MYAVAFILVPRERVSARNLVRRIFRRHSIASSRFSGRFLLLILIDRAASSYQLLNLSLAVLPLDRLFSIADLLSFEVGVLVHPLRLCRIEFSVHTGGIGCCSGSTSILFNLLNEIND